MKDNLSNKNLPDINYELASITFLMQNKAYLKTILENQEKILAHLQDRDIKEIIKESDERFEKHLEKIMNDTFKEFDVNKLKR